jgi:peptide/nickel transport system substrate-binding protein
VKRLLLSAVSVGILSVLLAACGSAETPTPRVLEVEVTRVVTEQVEIVKEVPVVVEKEVVVKEEVPVEVEKEVVREVEKRVVQTVVVERQVIKEVVKEVERIVEVDPRMGGTIKAIPQASFASLDPQWTTATITLYPAANTMEGAFTRNDDLGLQAQLVDKWEISNNELTWTFTLRSGVMFHNGEPLTAADVIGAWERSAAKSGFGSRIVNDYLDSFEVVDDLTFSFTLSEPTGLLIASLATLGHGRAPWVSAREIWSQPLTEKKDTIIGTGPFTLLRWDPGDRVILERWADYSSRADVTSWLAGRHTPLVDKVEFIEVPDSAARVAALETGEVDWVDEYPSALASRIQSSPNAVFQTARPGRHVVMVGNRVKPPFNNDTAMRAVQVALDADKLMKAFAGGSKGVFWDTCPGMLGCSFNAGPMTSTAGEEYYNLKDLERGRELVKEAGVEGTHIRLMSPEDLVGFGDYTKPFTELLTDLGFDVEYQATDWATVTTRRADPELWEVFPTGGKLGLGGGLTPITRTFWLKEGWFNNYQDPEGRMEELFSRFARETDPLMQKAIMDDIQLEAYKSMPNWYIGQQTWPTGISIRLKNYSNKAVPYFADVWIEE